MKTALVSGSLGLVGRETTERLLSEGYRVYGIDNHARARYFNLEQEGDVIEHENYIHLNEDISHTAGQLLRMAIKFDVIVHCAAQPSHELANKDPQLDFNVNVYGTHTMLELLRKRSPKATFIHLSTTKVYSDDINFAYYVTEDKRYTTKSLLDEDSEIRGNHGIFGAHKLAADFIVQEYGEYYDLNTVIFRPGCITGKNHKGAREHGFLSYLAKCIKEGTEYFIEGNGKQVRDQIHVSDLVDAFMEVIKKPHRDVYVIGGGVGNSISILEAIERLESHLGSKLRYSFIEGREADHKWNVHDNSHFIEEYPEWRITKNLDYIIKDLI